jgi:hypothetical protein
MFFTQSLNADTEFEVVWPTVRQSFVVISGLMKSLHGERQPIFLKITMKALWH